MSFANTVQDKTDEAAASLLLDTLRHHNAQLLDISYQGSTSSAIFTRVAQFPTLRSVEVRPINPQSYPVDSSGGALSALRGLRHLNTVDIDFRMFPSASQVCRWLAKLGSLSTLRLCGSWEDIRGIFDRLTFRTVCRLSLIVEFVSKPKSSDNRINTDFFFQISSTFPHIRSLSLNIKNHQKHAWNSAVTFQDITELQWKAIENIDFQQVPITLSIQELKDVITLWPMLTHLSIVPEDQSLAFDALPVLSHIYSHGLRLQALNLPLNFSSLNDPLPLTFACPSKCPLRRLELLRPQNLPKTFQGKHVLARNLVRLFPTLAIVVLSPSDSSSGCVQDIQAIIQAFHDLLSSPPRLDIQCIAPTQTTIMVRIIPDAYSCNSQYHFDSPMISWSNAHRELGGSFRSGSYGFTTSEKECMYLYIINQEVHSVCFHQLALKPGNYTVQSHSLKDAFE